MPRLFVDDREIPFPLLGASSLDQVVRHIEDEHLKPDSVIRQIQVDGQPLAQDELTNNASHLLHALEEKERIEIFTGTVCDIAKDSIREAIAYLERIEAVTPSLVMDFQTSPGSAAFENLKQFYEGFYWLSILIGRLEHTFQVDPSSISVGGMTAHAQHLRFAAILRQLVEAQQTRDFIQIADLLEYEVLPTVPVWKEMFVLMEARLRPAR